MLNVNRACKCECENESELMSFPSPPFPLLDQTPTSELESSPGDSGRDYGRSDEGSEGDISDYDAQREEGQSLLEEEDQLIAAHR